jgi:hypothetical protein
MPISSTNRSNARDAHIADYYVTPAEEIKTFLRAFDDAIGYLPWEKLEITDPCAGGDLRNQMSYPAAIKDYHGIDMRETIDIREDSRASTITNYLTYKLDYWPDMLITNPPFNIALEVIKKALSDVRENGWVIMLLRLNFFGSKQRKPFWEEYMPRYVFVHHKRIKFFENGSTDSIEYAHFCWQKGNYPKYSTLYVI